MAVKEGNPVVVIDTVEDLKTFLEPFMPETKIMMKKGQHYFTPRIFYGVDEEGYGFLTIE